MLKQIPIRKNYLLIVGTILLLLISYQFAFKRTLEAWNLNKELKKRNSQTNDFSYQPDYLMRKSKNLANIVKRYTIDSVNFRSNVISVVSMLADESNVKLIEAPQQYIASSRRVYGMQKVRFEGDYKSLIQLLDKIYQKKGIGTITSVFLQKVQDRRLISNKLVMDTYLQGLY